MGGARRAGGEKSPSASRSPVSRFGFAHFSAHLVRATAVDATLKGLIALVAGTDVEARCAALLVLTHLKSVEDRTVRTVGDALAAKNVVVRDFALGYFERVQPRDGLAHLMPLL